MEFLTFWKIPGLSRTLPTATDIRAMRSSTEVTGVSYTKLSKNKSIHETQRRSPYMIGPVILPANESGHHDISTAVQKLRRDVDERQSCYVEEPRHAGTVSEITKPL